jgi:hypothetical protein
VGREKERIYRGCVGERLAGLPKEFYYTSYKLRYSRISINDFRRVENPHASQLRCVGTLAFCFHPVRYFKT